MSRDPGPTSRAARRVPRPSLPMTPVAMMAMPMTGIKIYARSAIVAVVPVMSTVVRLLDGGRLSDCSLEARRIGRWCCLRGICRETESTTCDRGNQPVFQIHFPSPLRIVDAPGGGDQQTLVSRACSLRFAKRLRASMQKRTAIVRSVAGVLARPLNNKLGPRAFATDRKDQGTFVRYSRFQFT